MNPVEVMTSESQERMLAIVTPENLDEVLALCQRWEIRASVIGRVTDTGRFRVYDGLFDAVGVPGANPPPPRGDDAAGGVVGPQPVADVPIGSLGDGPRLRPPARRARRPRRACTPTIPAPVLAQRFPRGHRPLGRAARAARVAEHRRQVVGVPPVRPPAVPQHRGRARWRRQPCCGSRAPPRALALSTDGKARFCALDPRTGAPARGARSGAQPRVRGRGAQGAGELPQLRQPGAPRGDVAVLRGRRRHERRVPRARHPRRRRQRQLLQRVARRRHRPDAGGRRGRPHRRAAPRPPPGPVLRDGDRIVLLGHTEPELGGSEWADLHGLRGGTPPVADLDGRAAAARARRRARRRDAMVTGVHDCSDGGLAVALAEMAIAGGCGFTVASRSELVPSLAWFSESASRVVVLSVAAGRPTTSSSGPAAADVPAQRLGDAGGDRLVADGAFAVPLADADPRLARRPPDRPRPSAAPARWDWPGIDPVECGVDLGVRGRLAAVNDPQIGHACGVFGVYAPGQPVAHLTYLGLYALQHRGQESAGIAVSDGETITVSKDMGLVTQVFDERRLAPLAGPPRDRAHPLLHHRVEQLAQRAAGVPLGRRRRLRARPQRQPHQHR